MSARGGIDLGGTKIQAVIVTGRGVVVGDARRPTPTTGGPRAVTAEMAATLGEAAEAAGVETSKLASVGVGSPGVIDARRGTVASARNLDDWIDPFPLARELGKAVGAPVAIGNDVSVATDAEFKLGAGKPYKSLLGVFWGTGVGGGIVLGRQAVGRPRGRCRDRPHRREEGRRAMSLRPRGLPRGVRGPRLDGGQGAPRGRARPQDRPVQDHGEEGPHPAHERRVGEGPGGGRRAGDRADGPLDRLPGGRHRLCREPPEPRGRGDRRRARIALRPGVPRPDQGRDDAARVRRRPPAGSTRRRPGRPRRRHRRGAAHAHPAATGAPLPLGTGAKVATRR